MAAIAANRTELLQIADAVARDKSIDKSVVLAAMEEAMQRAAKAHYGSENEIKVEIDPKTGETHVSRYLHVVEQVENDKTEISLADARARNPAAQVGDIIAETLPPVDFNRINAQNAKQVIVQKVRDAERERQFDEYKDRIGEIVHGIVKRSECGVRRVDRRSFSRAAIRNSWCACSRRKCPKSTTALSKFVPWRAIPAAVPRSR